jgi:hypothetical protein
VVGRGARLNAVGNLAPLCVHLYVLLTLLCDALSCPHTRVAQLAALRQQNSGLRAENAALRTALGGDREAAAALAAAGRAAQVRVHAMVAACWRACGAACVVLSAQCDTRA